MLFRNTSERSAMNKKTVSNTTRALWASAAFICSAVSVLADDKNGGTLMVGDKSYPLTHVLAYEVIDSGESKIMVVLSGGAVSSSKLKEAIEEDKDGRGATFNRPYLKLEFTKARELNGWSAGAGNTSMTGGSSKAKAELKQEDKRVIGTASQPNDGEGSFRSGFDTHFDVDLIGAGNSLPAAAKPGPAANVKPTVTGVFKGNGQEAKLAYVSARWREPFADQSSILLVFSEKDHSKDKKPDFKASFGEYGSALVISLHEDGSIFGCQVVHNAHEKKGFTSIGSIKTNNFSFTDGKVEGQLTTDGEQDTFGEKWDVDIKFVAPLGEIPAEFQPAEQKKTEKTADKSKKQTPTSASSTPADESTPPTPADQINVRNLAVTKDASDFEYKTLVQHLSFKSKLPVKNACAQLATNLKAQGWTTDGHDMVNPTSSILKRKRGEAELTIFVKPEGEGSQVKMFTKGLSWEGQ